MYILKMLATGLVLFVFWMQVLMNYFSRAFATPRSGPDDYFHGIVSLIKMVPVSFVLVVICLFVFSRFSNFQFRHEILAALLLLVGLNAILFLPNIVMSEVSLRKEQKWLQINDRIFYELTKTKVAATFTNGKWDESELGDLDAWSQALDKSDVQEQFRHTVGASFIFACRFSKAGCKNMEFLITPATKALLFSEVDTLTVEANIRDEKNGEEVTEHHEYTFTLKVLGASAPKEKTFLRVAGLKEMKNGIGPSYLVVKLLFENTNAYMKEQYLFIKISRPAPTVQHSINKNFKEYLEGIEEYRSFSAQDIEGIGAEKALSQRFYHPNSTGKVLVNYMGY